jgi:hypothetical protein
MSYYQVSVSDETGTVLWSEIYDEVDDMTGGPIEAVECAAEDIAQWHARMSS